MKNEAQWPYFFIIKIHNITNFWYNLFEILFKGAGKI